MKESIQYILLIGVAVSATAVFLFGTVWALTKSKNNDANTLISGKSIPTSYLFDVDAVPTNTNKSVIQYTI